MPYDRNLLGSATELALLRAASNLSHKTDALREYANGPDWTELEDYVANVVLAAAQLRNRFEEYEQAPKED